MTQYVPGATVYHLISRLDHKRNHAVAECGEEGEPVEADPDAEDVCQNCREDRKHVTADEADEADDDPDGPTWTVEEPDEDGPNPTLEAEEQAEDPEYGE